jgi:hypothetical protein
MARREEASGSTTSASRGCGLASSEMSFRKQNLMNFQVLLTKTPTCGANDAGLHRARGSAAARRRERQTPATPDRRGLSHGWAFVENKASGYKIIQTVNQMSSGLPFAGSPRSSVPCNSRSAWCQNSFSLPSGFPAFSQSSCARARICSSVGFCIFLAFKSEARPGWGIRRLFKATAVPVTMEA